MTNTALLEKLIADSGLKKSYLAKKADMSPAWFRACVVNKGEFREGQMAVIAKELGIEEPALFMAVFFAQSGALNAPNPHT